MKFRHHILGYALILLLAAGMVAYAALPQTFNPSSPADTDPVSQGATKMRDIIQKFIDVFGLPNNSAISGQATTIATDGTVNFSAGLGNTTTMNKYAGILRFVAGLPAQFAGMPSTSLQTLVSDSSSTASWRSPTYDRVHRTAGDVSTASTSLVDFTGASITLTTNGNPVLVGQAAECANDDAAGITSFVVVIDSILQQGTSGLQFGEHGNGSRRLNCSFVYQSAALSAGSHTIKLQWMASTGTSTTRASTTTSHDFWVYELR